MSKSMNWLQTILVRLLLGRAKELNSLCKINGSVCRVSIEVGFLEKQSKEREVDRELAEVLRGVLPSSGC